MDNLDKIIFLDIDGVLNVYCQGRDKYGCLFHKHFEDNLKYIIMKTNAKIIISSSWRTAGLEKMRSMWHDRKLPGEIIDITPYDESRHRGKEIQMWLNNHSILKYVIIDDDTDILESQLSNFVKTSNNLDHIDCVDIGYGLTYECAKKAVKILNS